MSIPCKMRPAGLESLPMGYTRLEFLESTGTQYIDTGINATNNTGVYAEWMFNAIGSDAWRNSNQHVLSCVNMHCPRPRRSSDVWFAQGSFGPGEINFELTLGKKNIASSNFQNSKTIIFNEASVNRDAGSSAIRDKVILYGYSNLTADHFFRGFVYSAKISEGTEIIRNFIPCLDPIGKPCMFDTVRRKPFYNSGTGQFIVGMTMAQALNLTNLPAPTTINTLTVSLPWEAQWDVGVQNALAIASTKGWIITEQYRDPEVATTNIPVSFLESTGTQYINTGIIPQNERLKAKFSILDKNQYNYVAYTQILTSKGLYLHRPSIIGYSPYSESGLLSVDLERVLVDFEPGKVYSAEVDFQKAVVDGQTLKEFNVPLFENYVPVCLFAYGEGIENAGLTKVRHPTKIKLYKFELYDNGERELDMLPCLSPTGTPCMYDSVSGQNFYNAGTGAFIAGFDTAEQARKLATLPDVTAETDETKKSLTVSIPLDIALDPGVQSALDVAAARGWTIFPQYREN